MFSPLTPPLENVALHWKKVCGRPCMMVLKHKHSTLMVLSKVENHEFLRAQIAICFFLFWVAGTILLMNQPTHKL